MAIIFTLLAILGAAINPNAPVADNGDKVSTQDFHFVMKVNKSTPKL